MDTREDRIAALVDRVDALHAAICAKQSELLGALAELEGEMEPEDRWEDDGAHCMEHWTSMRLGMSYWKAERWHAAARVLPRLTAVTAALRDGRLGIDKIVELTRFAEPEDEDALVRWALDVSSGAIRRQGELRARVDAELVIATEERRWLEWRFDDEGRSFWMEAELPSAQGAVVANALERLAREIPELPGEAEQIGTRRADALVALCSTEAGGNAERADVSVHVTLEDLLDAEASASVDGGSLIPASAARRLLCNANVSTLIHGADGSVLGRGRTSRAPSKRLMKLLRYRDDACRFPSCGARRFTHAHHIDWWSHGGPTDMENLVLICSFHHRLVHEHGWRIERDPDGQVRWFRPDGTGYRAGPISHEFVA